MNHSTRLTVRHPYSCQRQLRSVGAFVAAAWGGEWKIWILPIQGSTARLRILIDENRLRITRSLGGGRFVVATNWGLQVVDLTYDRASMFSGLHVGNDFVRQKGATHWHQSVTLDV